jgi:hypothetical protein
MAWFTALLGPISNVILNIFKNKQDNAAKLEQSRQDGKNLEVQKVIKQEETKKAEIDHYTDLGTAGAGDLKAKLIFYIIAVPACLGILAGIFPDQVNLFVNNIKLVFDDKTLAWFMQLVNSFVGNMEN